MAESNDPLPDWAVAHARASLTLGHRVSEIEERLVGKGLSPETASAIVQSVVDAKVRQGFAEAAAGDSWKPKHFLLSGGVVVAFLAVTYLFGSGYYAARTLLLLLPGLLFIWAPEVLARSGEQTFKTISRLVGWGMLFLLGGMRVYFLFLRP